MTDAEKLRELAKIFNPRLYYNRGDGIFLRRIADLLDAIPPETIAALKAGMKTAMPTALLRQIASQRLSGEMQEEARHDADFMEGYDCVVKLVRAMLSAAAPEKPE